MAKVKVCKWTKFSVLMGEDITSRRMATRETVARMGGVVIENTEIVIDEAQLEQDGEGWTSEDFKP